MAEENNQSNMADRRNTTEAALIGLAKDFTYLQRDISEIKKDVKEIKNESIGRREFDEWKKESNQKMEDYKKDTDKRISFITGVLYTIGSTIILGFLGALIKLIYK